MKIPYIVITAMFTSMISNAGSLSKFENLDDTQNPRLKAQSTGLNDIEIKRLVNDTSAISSGKRITISPIIENSNQDRYSYYYSRKSASEIEFKWISDSLVLAELETVPNAQWIKSLPAALIPNGSGFEHYRESAARMKSNILLLYKIDANIYENVKLFGKNSAMAISTIDFVVLNVAEGSIINSVVVSKRVKIQQNENESSEEMIYRAKSMAIIEGLKEGISKIKKAI